MSQWETPCSLELLIVGPSWLGDAVMMGALVARLKATAPERRITVLTPDHLDGLVRRLPGVEVTLINPFAHGALQLGARAAFGRALRGRFDAAIVLPQSWKSALVPFFAGVRRRIGFVGEARYGLLSDARPLDETALPRMVDRFALLAEPRWRRGRRTGRCHGWKPIRASVAAVLARLGLDGFAPSASALCVGTEYGPAKRWPAAHFATLARRARKPPASTPGWIGGPGDAPIGAEGRCALPPPSATSPARPRWARPSTCSPPRGRWSATIPA